MKKELLKLVLFTLLVTFVGNRSYAAGYPWGHIPKTLSYDLCLGAIDYHFITQNSNDNWDQATIKYKNTSNAWVSLLQLRKGGSGQDIYILNSSNTITAKGENIRWGTGYQPGFTNSDVGFSPPIDHGGGNWSTHFYILKLPQDIQITSNSIEVQVNFMWWEAGSKGGARWHTVTETMPLNSISAPQTINATNNLCNNIDLSWSNPFQNWTLNSTCSNYGNYTTDIYRDNVLIASDVSGTNYTDNNSSLTPGIDYNYKTKIKWNPSGNSRSNYYSSFSPTVIGKIKDIPNQPTNFSASDDRCDGTVVLNWGWNDQNPQGFKIFKNSTLIGTKTGGVRSFTDTTSRGQTNTYGIEAFNDCDRKSARVSDNGISPSDPIPATNLAVVTNTSTNTNTFTWTDNATNETEYEVIRQDDDGNTVTFSANYKTGVGSTVSYIDNTVSACKNYTYHVKVMNACSPSGIIDATLGVSAQLPPPKLDSSFNKTGNYFSASKGYFVNRVELRWSNGNNGNLDAIKIHKRELGSTSPFVQIANVTAGTQFYIDNNADASTYYEYMLAGEKFCLGTTHYTDSIRSIGFRSASALVSGHVEYTGGIAVEGVKINLVSQNGTSGKSLAVSPGNYGLIPNSPSLEMDTAISVAAYVKIPATSSAMGIIEKNGAFNLKYTASDQLVFEVITSSGSAQAVYNSAIDDNNYHHLSGTYDGDTIKLYLDGNLVAQTSDTGRIAPSTNSIHLGQVAGSSMNLDEVRIYNIAINKERIIQDFSRVLRGNETGLVAYYRLNAGAGAEFYDVSYYNGNIYNENHGYFIGTPSFSNTIPAAAKLGFSGYTNATGDYTAIVNYIGIGETFTATPQYLTHQFTPSSTSLYLGDNSQIQNGVSFEDISSFEVSGNVKYYPTNCSCPADGTFLKIDGTIVIKNGAPVTTDANGDFTIQVPIGEHFITVEKAGHEYASTADRFPLSGTWNFQAPFSGIQFLDSTFVKVIGKVVGGTREEAKPMIPGRSNNNIGKAEVVFETFNGCFKDSVITDNIHGDYTILLPPLKYKILDFSEKNISGVTNNFTTFLDDVFDESQLDIINIPPVQTITDTLFIAEDKSTWSSIDSVEYQIIKTWIYRSNPIIWVNDTLGNPYSINSGDTTLFYKDRGTGVTDTVQIPFGTYSYPIYQEFHDYKFDVGVIEVYTDLDKNKTDSVPVTVGNLTINNGLASGSSVKQFDLSDEEVYTSWNKDTSYFRNRFICGKPSIAYTAGNANNFLNQIDITYASGTITSFWNPKGDGTKYKGIVLGSRSSDGQSFVTVGPQIPTFVLRDPPGSQSFASLIKGSSTTSTTSWSVNEDLGANVEATVSVGTSFSAGIGVETETDIGVDVTRGITVETSASQSGSLVEKVTMDDSWETSSSTDFVGSGGDIYIGKAMNITFGMSGSIVLLKKSECGLPGIECREDSIVIGTHTYMFGKKVSLAAAPGGFATSFIYTQDHIVNTLIPRLEKLRNQLFTDQPSVYVTKITDVNDPGFGLNNDDPYFGSSVSTSKPFETEIDDTLGVSYIYHQPMDTTTDTVKSTLGEVVSSTRASSDSIRWFNQQIRLWKESIAMNEADKYAALNNSSSLKNNYSFSSGITYSNSVTTENEEDFTYEFEVGITTDMSIEMEATIGGTGISGGAGLSLKLSGGYGKSNTTTESTNWAFTFLDEDVGDFYSVDVRNSSKGWGPIFSTVAGETSCPWEGNDSSLYFENGGNKVLLSTGTFHRELAEMKVDGNPSFSQKLNIPAKNTATFNLELINLSESNDDIEYGVKVLTETNPDGAIISVDGYSPSTLTYPVSGGSSLFKTLVLEKGPIAYDYDSIAVVIHSLCNDPAVGDTVYLTAHFIPTCTDIDIANPLNKWVLNNSFGDSMNIVIKDYDINYNGLTSIGLEFKPTSQSSWIPEKEWYKKVHTTGIDSLKINQSSVNTLYKWGLTGLKDGVYDLRVKSNCILADKYSNVYTGVVDRINPHPFGTPSPADGILDPNDDIFIQFNESIDIGSINSYNFDVRGVLNNSAVRHSTSINFDGTSDYVEVSGGANFQKRSFTIEFWAKSNTTSSNQVIMSQGTDAFQSFHTGFNSSNEFYFTMNNQTVKTSTPVSQISTWKHYAIVYDDNAKKAFLYIDGVLKNSGSETLNAVYLGSGKITFGKQLPSNTNFFNGNIHEVRVWTTLRSGADISSNFMTELNRSNSGLLHNWRMNEAHGVIAFDVIRSRNATLQGATWEVNPNGYAAQFDGVDDYYSLGSSKIAITKEMDFTLEFWFRSNQSTASTLFSNGNGDGLQADSLTSWNIAKDASGIIHVYHKGFDFVATTKNYFDGNWHHFSLVLDRNANLTSYIDGNSENTVQSLSFEQMGAPEMYLGAHKYYVGPTSKVDSYYQGDIDEFRFWNTARKLEQIKRDLHNRMQGDEYALEVFLPFENYKLLLGIPNLTSDFTNQSLLDTLVPVTNNGGLSLITQTPTLKLPRPVEAVAFTYSVNNDKIIITPTSSPSSIENVTLDVTVKDVKDLAGNKMQSPKTWIAYMNKNQVLWQDDQLNFVLKTDSTVTFNATLVNSGGASKAYTIGGLPSWMTVSSSTGTISPNSTKNVSFTILTGQNVGIYDAGITLTTDFGFNEIMRINLEIKGDVPNWTVDPSKFQYSMSVIGEIEIDNVISTNPETMIAGFINNQIVGVANLQYLPAYDRYEAFIDLYSNQITGDSIKFKVYDATTGYIFVDVKPTIVFADNGFLGTTNTPITFKATTLIDMPIKLNNGWTWVSFPLNSSLLSNTNTLLSDVNASNGDILLGIGDYDQYDSTLGWIGDISNSGGCISANSYRIKTNAKDTIQFIGSRIHPDSVNSAINVTSGWNWIGFISTKNLSIQEAMGNYMAQTGDVLKSQYEFSYYDNSIGWSGSLTYLSPGLGYMLQSSNSSTFKYPIAGYLRSAVNEKTQDVPYYSLIPSMFQKTTSIIATGNLCEESLKENTNVRLGVFDENNELRGFAKPTINEIDGVYYFYITAYSNQENEILHFAYFDNESGEKLVTEAEITFVNNKVVGTPTNGVTVIVPDNKACTFSKTNTTNTTNLSENATVFPNPFNEEITITFNTKIKQGVVSIIDIYGKLIYIESIKEKNQLEVGSSVWTELANGVYYILVQDEESTQHIKVVKATSNN